MIFEAADFAPGGVVKDLAGAGPFPFVPYQAINNEFCKAMAKNVKRINREEDMGIPGLRKAKLSYNHVRLVEKYTVTIG